VEQLGPAFDRLEAEDGTPGMAHEHDPALAQTPAQVLGDLDRVGDHAIEGHVRRRRAVAPIGLGRAPLVPVGDREVRLPGDEIVEERRRRLTRAAVQEQDHRIGPVAALDGDPLLNAADPHEPALVEGPIRSPCATPDRQRRRSGRADQPPA